MRQASYDTTDRCYRRQGRGYCPGPAANKKRGPFCGQALRGIRDYFLIVATVGPILPSIREQGIEAGPSFDVRLGGPWHLEMLTQVMWPCILASANVPAFVRELDATYRTCTTRRDQLKLRNLPIFQSISRLVAIEFIDTPTENPEPQFHTDRFVAAMQEARESAAIYLNLWPDVVFAGQTLVSAAQAMRNGHTGWLPSFRVVSEICVEDVVNTFGGSPDSSISIAPGELVRLRSPRASAFGDRRSKRFAWQAR
jgi:hypothetical protein